MQSSGVIRRGLKSALLCLIAFCTVVTVAAAETDPWTVDDTREWKNAVKTVENLSISEGLAVPAEDNAAFRSVVTSYAEKRKASRIVFEQPPSWDNWTVKKGIEPEGGDAPIFLSTGEDDHWYLNALDNGGDYHAWHSSDMENWTLHKGAIEKDWVTSAEYADGTFYIYYDEPNDQDPHLIMDDDLTDTERREKGEAFADPSHGSDSGIFRASDGSFHLIYEDWNPIDASRHSWDSPLAGHSESPDGIHGFEPHEHPAPIDVRTTPLPEFGTFGHPSGKCRYHKHTPEQDAYGDFTLIQVGSQYYIFCDYDPAGGSMRMAYWTSDSLRSEFERGGTLGKNFHPDPTIGFAEGRFYIFAQGPDFVSSGPWMDRVTARAGVDTDGDGTVDEWTDWQVVREKYSRKEGFSRIVNSSPASIDLSSLPAGHGFAFQFKTTNESDNPEEPALSRVSLSFE